MAERHLFFLPAVHRRAEIGWRPAVDVYRGKHGWLIKCDLAGVCPDDIRIAVSGCRLTILGARRDWSIAEGLEAYTLEIAYTQFERTVELPCDVESAELSTDYRDGMLLISIGTER